jgi:hypothetical protein
MAMMAVNNRSEFGEMGLKEVNSLLEFPIRSHTGSLL